MNPASSPPSPTPIPTTLHLEFIRSMAEVEEAPNAGGEAVEAFHRSLFLQQHAPEWERSRQEHRIRGEAVQGLEDRLAYLWAALLPVGALAVKVGWDVLASARLRTLYLWACLGIGLDFREAIRLPQLLDPVAETLLDPGQETRVMVVGSPLYLDEREPVFSMSAGTFPSDGHLLAGRDGSVFGLKHRQRRLEGVTLLATHFGSPWDSDLHRAKVTRFWRLFLKGQGGRMASLTGDPAAAFRLALHPPLPTPGTPEEAPLDSSSTRSEMIHITREPATTDWITGETILRPASAPPRSLRGPLRIAIRWKGKVDLDLYPRARPGGPRLYFEMPTSPEGDYARDHRSSPEHEFEFIEFTKPVDLPKSRPRSISTKEETSPMGWRVRSESSSKTTSTAGASISPPAMETAVVKARVRTPSGIASISRR